MISDHFGERWESTDCNKMCDHCAANAVPSHSLVEIDISEFAEAVLKILARAKDGDLKMTALKLVEALRGRGASNLKLTDWKPPKNIANDKNHAENIVAHLLMENYIKEDFHFTPYNTISYLESGSRPVRKGISMLIQETGHGDHHQVETKRKIVEKEVKSKKKKVVPESEDEDEMVVHLSD